MARSILAGLFQYPAAQLVNESSSVDVWSLLYDLVEWWTSVWYNVTSLFAQRPVKILSITLAKTIRNVQDSMRIRLQYIKHLVIPQPDRESVGLLICRSFIVFKVISFAYWSVQLNPSLIKYITDSLHHWLKIANILQRKLISEIWLDQHCYWFVSVVTKRKWISSRTNN